MDADRSFFDDIDRTALIRAACEAQKHSYAPYSHFQVGAAVLTSSGTIVSGANVENASYPAGICAERNAIASGETGIRAVAIVGGPDGVNTDFCSPCGICRQVMREFGEPHEILIIMAKSEEEYMERTLEELLPLSFGPEFLGQP